MMINVDDPARRPTMRQTAYLYDDIFLQHDTGPGHPERSERLTAIHRKMRSSPCFNNLLRVYADRPADITQVELTHRRDYILRAQREIELGAAYFDSIDNTVCRQTFNVALHAVGGCVAMCDIVMSGAAENGFCVIRPPGHHAGESSAAGFCLFNNIAIAARYVQRRYGARKVGIVDWDVHHGNGTQDLFDYDKSVYYISLHQYPYYPGTGSEMECGLGEGIGYTLNVPMKSGAGDAEYLQAFRRHVLPAIESFRPDVLMISAGFDAHRDDPISSINLSIDMYYVFTQMLKNLARRYCGGKLIAILEGGYNTDVCAAGVERVITAMTEE